jgi:hypothetical protein
MRRHRGGCRRYADFGRRLGGCLYVAWTGLPVNARLPRRDRLQQTRKKIRGAATKRRLSSVQQPPLRDFRVNIFPQLVSLHSDFKIALMSLFYHFWISYSIFWEVFFPDLISDRSSPACGRELERNLWCLKITMRLG